MAAELWAEAAALQWSTNRVVIAHHDFVCALLDALTKREAARPQRAPCFVGRWSASHMQPHRSVVAGEHGASFSNWRHHNTGITVLDISAAGHVFVRTVNTVTHLAAEPSLVSGVKS